MNTLIVTINKQIKSNQELSSDSRDKPESFLLSKLKEGLVKSIEDEEQLNEAKTPKFTIQLLDGSSSKGYLSKNDGLDKDGKFKLSASTSTSKRFSSYSAASDEALTMNSEKDSMKYEKAEFFYVVPV